MTVGLPHKIISTPLRFTDNHLLNDEKLMALLSTYYPVAIDNEKNHSEKLIWCLENCRSKFRDIKSAEGRIWYFQNQQDATLFALRWS